ncbi:MAG: ferredoxin [Burkholderiales bacterium RIFCSPHIGHO2_01_FULL_64_960]|nr:MAG: ferredoxin [Burkholderiales bacterium RIFCSPHIGHO2_01_FULL_64_960]
MTELRLRQVRLEAEGICSYEFVAPAGRSLPPFEAGAHIDLHLPEGRIRSYSLANAPHEGERYLVAVQREEEGRGGSAWMHHSMRVGQVLAASAPLNDFPLVESAEHSVFIAGGIGITPILSMIARLDALGRSWHLHYASRAPEFTAFLPQLEALDRGRGRVACCFGSDRTERLDIAGIVGHADAATHLYCCGPARMIDAFVEAGRGRPPVTMHFERFAAAEAPAVEGGYTVVLQKSGRRLPVLSGKTLLDTLLDEDVSVPYACSNGICGTCLTGVVSGTPDHRDEFLSDEERRSGKCMLVCCSGSLTPELVLDL